ncbi:Double-stranded RNA-binding domain [Dillenia turbinata]|uniref:Double-stranded RNA-binding domain n=1 Tax=Dillenia turbinata TaxID=194707 RepID=A0AAN8ZIH2_9MAGN
MYKSKLQELCHKNAWTLREYRQQRDGPEYSPRFSASPKMAPHASLSFTSLVIFGIMCQVNGTLSAIIEAARMRERCYKFIMLGKFCTSSISDIDMNFSPAPKDNALTGTQETSQTPNPLTKETAEHGGPFHASLFKARVIVDGKTFEATEYYYTVKEAEHAAAKVALKSLVPDGIREDELGIYKNLLQELTQKEGCNLPQYSTFASGEPHMLVFVSTVEVDGKTFQGPQSKTKKEAEMGAAKVAYNCLKEISLMFVKENPKWELKFVMKTKDLCEVSLGIVK